MKYEDKLKKMSNEGIHLECVTLIKEITDDSNGKLSTPKAKDLANSIMMESIKRMEKDDTSVTLLQSCTTSLQTIIKDSSEKYSDIPKKIIKWEPPY